MLTPHAILLASLFLPQTQAPSEARALYDQVMKRYTAAKAVDIEASLIGVDLSGAEELEIMRGTVTVHMMKPLRGNLRVDYQSADMGDSAFEFIATGDRLYAVEHGEKMYIDLSGDHTPLATALDLDPFLRWAGIQVGEPQDLALLAAPDSIRGLRGLTFMSRDLKQTWWIDDTGVILAASVIPTGDDIGYGRPRLDYTFRSTRWTAEPDPKEFNVGLPKGYTTMDLGEIVGAGSDEPIQSGKLELNYDSVGKPAPAATFTAMNGDEQSLESLRGKTVLLNFWFYH